MAQGFGSDKGRFSFEEDGESLDIYPKKRRKKVKYEQRESFSESQYTNNNAEGGTKAKSFLPNLFEWLDVIVISVIAVVIIFTFLFRIVSIDGDSMLNTLHHEEKVVISNLFYTPKRGDIVVISRNNGNADINDEKSQPIIKRVIATEGETVYIDFALGVVYVDGKLLSEPYAREPIHMSGDVTFPVRVPENCVFVLGDNRNASSDSRFSDLGDNGMVNEKYILGKAVFRVSPLKRVGGLYEGLE